MIFFGAMGMPDSDRFYQGRCHSAPRPKRQGMPNDSECDSNHILSDLVPESLRGLVGRGVVSTIQEVRAAEKKVQEILRELKKTDLTSRDDLHEQLRQATEEYVKAVSELRM